MQGRNICETLAILHKKTPQRAKAGNDCHSVIKVVELEGKDGASEA